MIGFEIASGEALANCVEHSGGPLISVDCWFDDARLITEIRQQGRGFDPPASVRPPVEGAPRGYGLFIMHEILDAVEIFDGGRGLRLIKNVPDAARA